MAVHNLIVVAGAPHPYVTELIGIVRDFADAAPGGHVFVECSTHDELESALIDAQSDVVVCHTPQPELELIDVLKEKASSVVLLDVPICELIADIVAHHNVDLFDAVRRAASYLAPLHALRHVPRLVVLGWTPGRDTLFDLIQRVSAAIPLEPDPKQLQEIVLRRLPQEGTPMEYEFDAILEDCTRFNPESLKLSGVEFDVEALLMDLFGCSASEGEPWVRPLEWPARFFSYKSDDSVSENQRVDLTGAARIFVFGPYTFLPAGRWRVVSKFSVAENKAGNVLKLDVFAGEVLAEGTAILPVDGTFSCELEFDHYRPRAPLEIRFHITEGAIDGTFQLRNIRLVLLSGSG